jgi:hypothetical protein
MSSAHAICPLKIVMGSRMPPARIDVVSGLFGCRHAREQQSGRVAVFCEVRGERGGIAQGLSLGVDYRRGVAHDVSFRRRVSYGSVSGMDVTLVGVTFIGVVFIGNELIGNAFIGSTMISAVLITTAPNSTAIASTALISADFITKTVTGHGAHVLHAA